MKTTLRYRIISNEVCETSDFIRLDIASFRLAADAIAVCKLAKTPCYVIDTFETKTLYHN